MARYFRVTGTSGIKIDYRIPDFLVERAMSRWELDANISEYDDITREEYRPSFS